MPATGIDGGAPRGEPPTLRALDSLRAPGLNGEAIAAALGEAGGLPSLVLTVGLLDEPLLEPFAEGDVGVAVDARLGSLALSALGVFGVLVGRSELGEPLRAVTPDLHVVATGERLRCRPVEPAVLL